MKKTYKRGGSLNTVILNSLVEVFSTLKWEIENEDRFGHFCKLLSRLKDDEQQLILELTRDFLHCSFNRYEATLRSVIPQLEGFIPEHVEEIIIAPLIGPKDEIKGKSKSSNFLVYPLQEALERLTK